MRAPRGCVKGMAKRLFGWLVAVLTVMLAAYAAPGLAHSWHDVNFANRPLYAYPLPSGRDDLIGSLTTYRIQPGDTLLDVGRWFGLSAKEISDANGHMDWWLPPAGREVILPTEHILPDSPRAGIILNVPEMRLYYYFPSPAYVHARARHKKGKLMPIALGGGGARVVYTFPVGLGRFDWKTPLGVWRVTAKVRNPIWVMPEDIYQEHLERDGEADKVVPAGPDNPLGLYKLDLSIPEYGLHGTNVPWGIGMTVSHGCVRLYPEDIERLFSKTPVGTPGEFVYQPVKFGWRGDALYAEVHDDLYGKYPGLWNLASQEAQRHSLAGQVDMVKLEKLVEARSGIPSYVGFGPEPAGAGLPTTTDVALPVTDAVDSRAPAAYAPAPPMAGRVPAAESADAAGAPAEPAASADSGATARPRSAVAPGLSTLPTTIVTSPSNDDAPGSTWEPSGRSAP
jgi:L,D-transpeptidase ErfK/SrfK